MSLQMSAIFIDATPILPSQLRAITVRVDSVEQGLQAVLSAQLILMRSPLICKLQYMCNARAKEWPSAPILRWSQHSSYTLTGQALIRCCSASLSCGRSCSKAVGCRLQQLHVIITLARFGSLQLLHSQGTVESNRVHFGARAPAQP